MQLLLSLLLSLITLSLTSATRGPRFVFDPKQQFMLGRGDPWQVGSISSVLLFGKDSEELKIKLVVGGGTCTLRNKEIQFFCSNNAAPEIMNLARVSTNPENFCTKTDSNFQVSLKKISGDDPNKIDYQYGLDFISSRKGNVGQIWIKVKVECEEKTLLSEALNLWNIDGLANYNDGQEIHNGAIFHRHFLRSEGLNWLIQKSTIENNKDYASVQFFDDLVLRKYETLPLAVKSAVGFGVSIFFADTGCNNPGIDFVKFSHSDSNVNKISKMNFVDIKSGNITFAVYGVANQLQIQQQRSNKITICAQLYTADSSFGFFSHFQIVKGYPLEYLSPASAPSESSCQKVPNAPKEIVIAAGSGKIVVTCPIICSNSVVKHQFNFGSKTIASNENYDWEPFGSWRISRFGNKLEFPSDVDVKLNGSYSCSAGSVTHDFDVKVLSLPHFDKESQPPEKVVAVEGQPLQLKCKIKFSNIDSTKIYPVIQTNQMSVTGSKWETVSLTEFNELVGLKGGDVMKEKKQEVEGGKEMEVSVAAVPPPFVTRNSNFSHRFLCKANISGSDAEKFGMKSFGILVGSDVYFLAKPKLSDFSLKVTGNDCRNQQTEFCTAADGAEFSVNVAPSINNSLDAIGADIKIKFKIDNTIVTDFRQLFDNNLTTITTDPVHGTVSLKISQIPEGKLRDEFLKMKKLRPIFEFYLKREDTSSPRADSECSANKDCFYSTELDESRQLDGLYFPLSGSKPKPVAAANIGLIAGIALTALLILLILVLLILILRRDSGQTYMLDEKERQQGNHPEQEAKDEQFKEYQRPESSMLRHSAHSLNSDISAGSDDDRELNEYENDGIDLTKFGEDGSFIGNYSQAKA